MNQLAGAVPLVAGDPFAGRPVPPVQPALPGSGEDLVGGRGGQAELVADVAGTPAVLAAQLDHPLTHRRRVAHGQDRGRLERSARPSSPSASQRSRHLRTVLASTCQRSAAASIVQPSSITARTMSRPPRGHVDRLFSLRRPPTAIFVGDGAVTLWVLERLQALEVRYPDDVSLIGFDDVDWATVVRPRLTVVAQPVSDLGELSAISLVARIRGDAGRVSHHVLPTRLIERDSVGPPAAEGAATARSVR